MAIYGDAPLENDEADDAYSVTAIRVSNYISKYLDDTVDEVVREPDVIGYVRALRFLVQAEPIVCSITLEVSLVEKWKQQYADWIDKFGSKVRVKRGVDRDLM